MTAEQATVLTQVLSNHVGIITLNRPERHNAFDETMIKQLTNAFNAMEQNPLVKIILLTSQGKSFSAGADLAWMQRMVKFSQEENLQDATTLQTLMQTIYDCLKPTVAMVQGNAFGGGVGLVACCQWVIAAENAKFCFSEVKLGLIPAIISPFIINAIGARAARAYFLSAKTFDALTAKQLGLCHEVVALERLETHTFEVIADLLHHGPQALKAVNALFNQLPAPEIAKITIQKLVEIRTSQEGQEGIKAFLEKRKPNWVHD
ncbi:MAG: enoyl-CoA hydratase/isomerase family protein [Proteobacteria bacterium]|nr:enoyl-CoA hydratase/isomerase family protein [Pseudomonadota bacterium]